MQVYSTDDYVECARKIYYDFEINQSCSITGFMVELGEVTPKGEKVLAEITRLDKAENFGRTGGRIRKILPNTIGGWVAQKIFKWKADENGKYDIWRIQ